MAIRVSNAASWNGVSSQNVASAESVLEIIYNHYHTIAYTIVIAAYVLGFGEYAILRIKSLVRPERQVQFSNCDKRSNELVGKTAYHYAVVLFAFIVIALFQLVCFFGLTISSKWIYYSISEDFDRVAQLRQELAARIRNQMYSTLVPAFVSYVFCALSICVMIYYMDGIQDGLDTTVASIFMYAFDAAILSYFLSFPLITCLYRRPAATPLRSRKDDRNNNSIIFMESTTRHRPVASTDTSGSAPMLFPRRYSYMIANDEYDRNRNRERFCLSTCRNTSNFVRNMRLTTTV